MKTLFIVTFIVGLVFSLGFIIIPGQIISGYGITDNSHQEHRCHIVRIGRICVVRHKKHQSGIT